MSKISRKEETRHNFVEAFWTLYVSKPLDKITVKEITDLAGYNRGTFYTYFADVYEVLETEKKLLLPSEETIIERLKMLSDDHTPLERSFENVSHCIRENRARIAILLGPEGDPGFQYELKARFRRVILDFAGDIGIQELSDYEYIIEYHVSGMIGMYQRWVENEEDITEERLGMIYERVFNEGVMRITTEMFRAAKKSD
ncbi:TetR/AcrR family transcriptional regulator [Salinicoccus jeotgali]|uniref:TetR/AcrR family transcriptional regulator n=1 Tax=Salinicoccus jeotgali TaxID=381634 RepID=A0ABP7F9R6_9STAP